MTIAVTVQVDASRVTHLANTLPSALEANIGNTMYAYAVRSKVALQQSLIQGDGRPITPDRFKSSQEITAKKVSKYQSLVKMPLKLIYLDSMRPHYVSLKRGRRITDWTMRNFGNAIVSGRSRVFASPRGGIFRKWGNTSALYVTPMPFINRGLNRVRRTLNPDLRSAVRKAFKAARR